MSLVTVATDASLDAASASHSPQVSGRTAGEALDPFAPCYIKNSDGLVYMSNATSANEAAGFDGFTPKAYAIGDSNVTLFGIGTKMRYATGLTPGATLYIAATKGRLDTASTTGDAIGVARVVDTTVIRVTRNGPLSGITAGAGTVSAASLTATLATGMIPLPLAQARIIASNDIAAKGTPDGGLVSLDTDPTLKRVNGATDKKLRMSWAASSVIPVQWDITYPPDLDDTANVVIHILAAMAGAVDTPTLAVNYFEGLGDTNAGGNTAAITGTTIAEYTRTITGANIGTYPNGASVEFVLAAHTTDALHLYAAWVEYTRK